MLNKITFTLTVIFAALLLFSCKKDAPATPEDPSFKGDFISAAHPTSGTAYIDKAMTTLTLSGFNTDAGPDLNIYLATHINNVTSAFIDLGDIKGVNGNYEYDLPGQTDYKQYKFVVVWCVAFNVNFGYAELVEQ